MKRDETPVKLPPKRVYYPYRVASSKMSAPAAVLPKEEEAKKVAPTTSADVKEGLSIDWANCWVWFVHFLLLGIVVVVYLFHEALAEERRFSADLKEVMASVKEKISFCC